IHICGYNIEEDFQGALKNLGCIVENPELYPYLSGYNNLLHFARMLEGVGEERIKEVTELVGLTERIHDKVKTYSLGMRQRLGIAQALLG
ncbi:ATP-binding cassette domain-containing protein, partial [Alkalihalophilus lindianensis]